MDEKDIESTEDYVSVSSELDALGDAELRHPGDPELDDEESLDNDLLNGADTSYSVNDDIDTLNVIDDDNESESTDESRWNDGSIASASETAVDDGEFTDEQG